MTEDGDSVKVTRISDGLATSIRVFEWFLYGFIVSYRSTASDLFVATIEGEELLQPFTKVNADEHVMEDDGWTCSYISMDGGDQVLTCTYTTKSVGEGDLFVVAYHRDRSRFVEPTLVHRFHSNENIRYLEPRTVGFGDANMEFYTVQARANTSSPWEPTRVECASHDLETFGIVGRKSNVLTSHGRANQMQIVNVVGAFKDVLCIVYDTDSGNTEIRRYFEDCRFDGEPHETFPIESLSLSDLDAYHGLPGMFVVDLTSESGETCYYTIKILGYWMTLFWVFFPITLALVIFFTIVFISGQNPPRERSYDHKGKRISSDFLAQASLWMAEAHWIRYSGLV